MKKTSGRHKLSKSNNHWHNFHDAEIFFTLTRIKAWKFAFNQTFTLETLTSNYPSSFRLGHYIDIMTSWNGNIFSVTGPLWGELWFPSQRPVTWNFDIFFGYIYFNFVYFTLIYWSRSNRLYTLHTCGYLWNSFLFVERTIMLWNILSTTINISQLRYDWFCSFPDKRVNLYCLWHHIYWYAYTGSIASWKLRKIWGE